MARKKTPRKRLNAAQKHRLAEQVAFIWEESKQRHVRHSAELVLLTATTNLRRVR